MQYIELAKLEPERDDRESNKSFKKAGALVQWLWEETHVPKVIGSNPSTLYFHYICCKNCNDVCLKRPKINDKRGRG